MKLHLRKRAVLADLSRPRIGETSRPIASGVHVSPARRAMFGALGFTGSYIKERPRQANVRARDQEGIPDGRRA